jgi:hypothetical protein
MLKKPLLKTNPYLRDPVKRREMFAMTVYTSTGVEGVHLDKSDLNGELATDDHPSDSRESVESS